MNFATGNLIVLATDGSIIQSLPFFLPPVILICGLLVLTMRDRRRRRGASE